jgi:hypothetical protein
LKKQTGVWIDVHVWDAYKALCSREKLRPSEPIEEFLRLILQTGSALSVSSMVQRMAKARIQGSEAYARVLLSWYKDGKPLISVSDEGEAYVETLLLHALMEVADPRLRRSIEEALKMGPGKESRQESCGQKTSVEEEPAPKPEAPAEFPATAYSETIKEIEKKVANHEIDSEQAQKIMDEIRKMRKKLKTDEHG